jgi:alpha-1,3-fucosyltransferase
LAATARQTHFWNTYKRETGHLEARHTSWLSCKLLKLPIVLTFQYFQEINCEITTCVVTTHRDLFDSVTGYDAILFHESSAWQPGDAFPLERSPFQYYVLANLESHINEKHDYSTMRNAFNLSMTFRLDSDVMWPYAVVRDQITGQVAAPSDSPMWRTPDIDFHGE